MKKTIYKLKLDGEFLSFQEHGDYTEILVIDGDSPACFETQEDAIRAICDQFYFHHGCGSISDKDSAKDRLSKIELVEVVVIEEEKVIKPTIHIPTNLEIHQWYILEKGDTGLGIYLESAFPEFKGRGDKFKDDGYEFANDYYRIRDYNNWLAKGKPVNEKKAKINYVQAAIEKWCKGVI